MVSIVVKSEKILSVPRIPIPSTLNNFRSRRGNSKKSRSVSSDLYKITNRNPNQFNAFRPPDVSELKMICNT